MTYWNLSGLRVRLGQFDLAVRVLITGGFGFIGGRLAKHFSQAKHQVVLGSRYIKALPSWLPSAELARIEWYDEEALESCCTGVDVIIHAAGMNAQDCAADPVAALAFNGKATERLVQAAIKARVGHFIYLSTAHVYANPLVGTITEKTTTNNSHPYAASHLAGELSVINANKSGKIQGTVIRLSNAFGAPVHRNVNCWMLLVHDLCKQAVENRQLVLKSSGLQHRDFVPISYVCQVVGDLVTSNDQSKRWPIVNVGLGVSKSVLEMAVIIRQRCRLALGFDPALTYNNNSSKDESTRLFYMSDHFDLMKDAPRSQHTFIEIDRLLQFCQAEFL